METNIEKIDKEAQSLYDNRPVNEKHYNFEQWVKLYQLRNNKAEEIKSNEFKNKYSGGYCKIKDELKVGDPVRFSLPNGITKERYVSYLRDSIKSEGKHTNLQGYIIKINNTKDYWKHTYDVSSNLGIFKNVRTLYKRKILDLSYIDIPENVKNIHTKTLLKSFKNRNRFDGGTFLSGIGYVDNRIVQAELGNREHVFSNEDKKIMKQYGKKNVNKK